MRTTELRTPNRLIDRPALYGTLDEVLTKRLALIVAPAGAGKSTLIAQWAASRPAVEVAFVDLGGMDDERAALASALAAGRAGAEALPAGSEPDGAGAVAPARSDVVIVLDDLQDFMSVSLATALGDLLAHLPPRAHVILSSRAEPPIRLSKLRLAGEVLDLRQDDLAMSPDQALRVLEAVVGHPVDADGMQLFLDRVEGWAAGIQLAAIELKRQEDPDGFLAEFSGNDRLVADYLWEEVFRVLPGELQDLLLSASVLDVMSADIVDEVTGCGL